jgi:predicted nucleic acid-binding protein
VGLRGLEADPRGREAAELIRFLIDSSGLWRLMREDKARARWADAITAGAIGSCHPQRVEFRRSARNPDEYEQMSQMFDALYPDVPVPKRAWQWVESTQFTLVRAGAHRALSAVDLLVAATAALNRLTILHDDNDFRTAARRVPDLVERRVRDAPTG